MDVFCHRGVNLSGSGILIHCFFTER